MDRTTLRERLTEIAECRRQIRVEIETRLTELADLEEEELALWTEFLPREPRPDVPLPAGMLVQDTEVDQLRLEIQAMDPDAFSDIGRAFIRRNYPRLAQTAAWHELSAQLQKHFGMRRQQIAGVAARIARETGEELVASREATTTRQHST